MGNAAIVKHMFLGSGRREGAEAHPRRGDFGAHVRTVTLPWGRKLLLAFTRRTGLGFEQLPLAKHAIECILELQIALSFLLFVELELVPQMRQSALRILSGLNGLCRLTMKRYFFQGILIEDIDFLVFYFNYPIIFKFF